MKNRTPASTVILYIFAFIFLAISIFMLAAAWNFQQLYLESLGAKLEDMWENVVLYLIEQFIPYFGLSVLTFGVGRAISAAKKSQPIVVPQTESDGVFDDQSPIAIKLEELRQVNGIKLEEMERREKVRLEETKNAIQNEIEIYRVQREEAENALMQKLATLEVRLAGGVIPGTEAEGFAPAAVEDGIVEEAPATDIVEARGDAAEEIPGEEIEQAASEEPVPEETAAEPDEVTGEVAEETEESAAEEAAEAEAAAEAEEADEKVEPAADSDDAATEEAEPEEAEPQEVEAEAEQQEAEEETAEEAAAEAEEAAEEEAAPADDAGADTAETEDKPEDAKSGEDEDDGWPEVLKNFADDTDDTNEAKPETETAEGEGQAETGEEAAAEKAGQKPEEKKPETVEWDDKKENLKILEPARQNKRRKKKRGRKSR